MPEPKAPSIFISYSHDSDAHKAFVRSIADQLRKDGLDCQIDQYINGFPPEGWQRWMEMQVEDADFVLLVCTEKYLQRYRGQDPDGGRGVNFEGVVISQTLYDAYYRNTKFIPVIPQGGNLKYVPLPLKGFSTYTLPTDYTALYRVLTGQHATPAPEIGEQRYLPPEKAGGLALRIDLENETIEAASFTTLPDAAVKAKLKELQTDLHVEKSNNRNLSDLLERYRDEIQAWKEKYEEAIAQNEEDLEQEPDNPLLQAEHEALQDGDFELSAQLREKYFRKKLTETRAEQKARLQALEAQIAEENRMLSHEAFISGERWQSANNLIKALPLYQEAVEIDRGNLSAWRGVSKSADKLGNTTLALTAVRGLKEQLSPEKNSKWYAIAITDEADLLVKLGEKPEAFTLYLELQKHLSKLVEAEPENTEWQRDLSVSHNKVGDMHKANGDGLNALKAYEDGLAIAKTLAELDPKHTEWQRDLSVSYDRVGDMHKANGDGLNALKAYEDGLAIAKTLAELDPKHTEWQRDLSVSHNKVGDMHKANGDGLNALKAYEESLAIRKTLAELNPEMVEWQTDLVVSYYKLSTVQPEKSKALLTDALAILNRLHSDKRLDHETQQWIPALEDMIAE